MADGMDTSPGDPAPGGPAGAGSRVASGAASGTASGAPSGRGVPGTSGRRASLRAADRASADLRRGDLVLVRPDEGPALLIQASESVTAESIDAMRRLTGRLPWVVVTMQRAAAVGLDARTDGVMRIEPESLVTEPLVRDLADPLQTIDPAGLAGIPRTVLPADSRDGAVAAIKLAKLARLLPAVLAAPVERPLGTERLVTKHGILSVGAFDIENYDLHAARSLEQVADARVPLAESLETRVVAFRPTDGGQEHLALVIGTPAPEAPTLVRLHSECFTGDFLGSLRCDCGQQLRGAVAEIARHGAGVLLYLAQEGRGIGLVNKLRAYRLQDARFDTVDANEMLGYDADERLYQPAAEMLRQLGVNAVRLMTNNPEKVDQLARCGINVVERVPHIFPANGHNEFYLNTKKTRSGHLL
jgi:GTP cyclohydrolase II